MTSPATDRPTRPLPFKPAGHVELARYSSLGRYWALLGGAARAGRRVTLVRGDSADLCRRRIAGATLMNAGIFLDVDRTARHLDDGFAPHAAMVALLAGDPAPLREELNAHFELRVDFTLALTATRDLICRPELRFMPVVPGLSSLPDDLTLEVRRLGRDELHLLVQRACGLA
ncbi:hypothetical protein LAJ19_07070 [Deinococcus taeanensis]|uniref:hypothetical protein n=1 Tax=Deinococcus taeanensis TaxID=2737050 RepID=UPI001CDC7064|nr:hypothetical protein [Deinococcus taeanensis]UBV41433.1 hypothetical protein LAJ19_07070 [Deinococcus taeanensis]